MLSTVMFESRVISILCGGTLMRVPRGCESVAGEGLEGLAPRVSVLLTVPAGPISKQQLWELSCSKCQ